MLGQPPYITHHAIERAYARLGMDASSFINWVNATHHSWIGVNPTFLRNRNVGIITNESADHYVNPWTMNRGVVMVIKHGDYRGVPQSKLVSVLDFDYPHDKRLEFRPDELAEGYAVTRTPLESVAMKLVRGGVLDLDKLGALLGFHIVGGDLKYLVAFADDELSLVQLFDILRTPKEEREETWHHLGDDGTTDQV